MKTRILFVDDEAEILEVLRLMLLTMSERWEVDFAEGGTAALAKLAQQPFDVVVTDMRMPGMSGAQLLREVLQRYPRTVRVMLSGLADEDQVMGCIDTVHQFLTKPFELAALEATLSRIDSLNHWLMNEDLRRLLGQLSCLPSVPTIYFRILQALESPDASLDQIGEIISTDPALTAKILQLVNSAFFGFARTVSSATEAVQILGGGLIRSLALSCHVFSAFDSVRFRELSLDQVWTHSLQTGMLAKRIAQLEDAADEIVEQAFTGGALHDIGKLVLAANLPEPYRQAIAAARAEQIPLHQAESQVFNATHADIGSYLLGVWGLPVPLVEAIGLHHDPRRATGHSFTPLTAVHAANALDHARNPGSCDSAANQVDRGYLARLGLHERLAAWQAEAIAE